MAALFMEVLFMEVLFVDAPLMATDSKLILIPHECKNCKYNELQIDNDGFCSGECYWSYQFSKRVNNKKERERRYQQIAQTEKLHY